MSNKVNLFGGHPLYNQMAEAVGLAAGVDPVKLSKGCHVCKGELYHYMSNVSYATFVSDLTEALLKVQSTSQS